MCNAPKLVFYPEWEEMITNESDDNKRLQLYEAIMNYAFKGEEPTDPYIRLSIFLVKKRIDADREKWEDVRAKRTEAGRRGGTVSGERRSRKAKKADEEKKEEPLRKSEEEKEEQKDSVEADAENVKVETTVEAIPKECLRPSTCIEVGNVADWLRANGGDAWKEAICMKEKVNIEDLDKLFSEFQNHLICKGQEEKQIKDIRNHFFNWMKSIKNEHDKGTNVNGTAYQTKEERDAIFNGHILSKLGYEVVES